MKTAIFITALTLGSVALSQAATTLTLIGGSTNNGDFNAPYLLGEGNKILLDASTGNLTNWTGTDNNTGITGSGPAKFSNGNYLFLQPDEGSGAGTATNMTTQTIAVGDTFSYSIDRLITDSVGNTTMSLVYKDGSGTIQTITGSTVSVILETPSPTYTFTVQSGDAWVGKTVGLHLTGSTNSNGYVDLDNAILTVTAVPEPSSAALLGLGGLALIFRRRKG